jgi:hypothetical protein
MFYEKWSALGRDVNMQGTNRDDEDDTEDRRHCDKETAKEDGHERQFLCQGHVRFPKHRQRYRQEIEVSANVHGEKHPNKSR